MEELDAALFRRGDYENSVEELTPLHRDLRGIVPVVAAALATVADPGAWRWFSSGALRSYALTPAAWREILRDAKN
jgi:hypothetical protein